MIQSNVSLDLYQYCGGLQILQPKLQFWLGLDKNIFIDNTFSQIEPPN